jgi:23S rRNA pseudouridine2605 synthase
MRYNGNGTLTLEDARTWIEETGLCLFLPRKQFTSSVAPSFVEAVAGSRDATPDPKQIALAEDLLVRLENDGVAARLNLSGQPGEQPDFVVATWVLPYVYALRGDRDWRRIPQLTGSRAVSQLAVQSYKLLEANDSTVPQLKHALGREVSESAVVRAITELWQQLRIIPVIAARGQAAKWQLLRQRYQKAIAEGASTSQVTAISVLASIYLQAVIAASMEEVELFLAPLTARSKVREVLRGLVATRQVHTISLGHAPHFYVAGTLPEFAPASMMYSNSSAASSYFSYGNSREDSRFERPFTQAPSFVAHTPAAPPPTPPTPAPAPAPEVHASAEPARPVAHRPHFTRPARTRTRKPAQSGNGARLARRTAESRPSAARPASARNGNGTRPPATRTANGARPVNGTRWSSNGKTNGHHAAKNHAGVPHSNGSAARSKANGASAPRNGKSAAPSWSARNGAARNGSALNGSGRNGHGKTAAKPASIKRTAGAGSRVEARASRNGHKPAHKQTLTAGAKANNSKRFGFTGRPAKGTKKRG